MYAIRSYYVPLDGLGVSEPPEIGQIFPSPYGQFKVIDVNETHATLDFNHELAGKTLVFRITSYNVCYTKLLRILHPGLFNLETDDRVFDIL